MAEPEPATATVGALRAGEHVVSGWNRQMIINQHNTEQSSIEHAHTRFVHITIYLNL